VKEYVRRVVGHGRAIADEYRRTRSSLAAGGLAYFVALSLAPAALAFGTLAGLLLDPADVRAALERLAVRAPEAFDAIKPVSEGLLSTIESASSSSFTIATVIGLVIAVYASSKVVLGLRMAMNSAFRVQESRSGFIERGIAAVVTLVVMVGGVALVVLLTLVPRVLAWLQLPRLPVTTGLPILDWVIVIALIFLAVRWLLRYGPNRTERVPWRSLGAWTATLGIAGATVGVGLYTHLSSTMGAAILVFGTAIVILLWLYLCFVALLWGAAIEAYAQRLRSATPGGERAASGGEPARGPRDQVGDEGGGSSGEAHVEGVRPGSEDGEEEGADAGHATGHGREREAPSRGTS
jgi:membrane protein